MDFDVWVSQLEEAAGERIDRLYRKLHGAPPQQRTLTLVFGESRRSA